jgi:tetratricopeptide (TPR) repeat protein
MVAAAIVLVGLLGALVAWTINRGDPPPPQAAPAAADATVVQTQQAIESRLEQASKALQAGDDAAAQRHADAVLAISPGHAEARRLRDLARQAGEAVTRGLSAARNHYGAGRYDEASRAAGEVLAVDPGNAEAKRLMDDSAARSQGKGVQEARTRTARARNAAAAAGAAALAADPYGAALAAEREAASLFKRGQLAEAMSKFWEASGLFRSAEVAAETEAAMRAERARLAQAERKPSAPATADARAPKPAPQPAPPPAPPIPTTTGLPQPPGAAPVQGPTPPPAAAPQQAPGEVSPPPVSPTAGINETVGRYRAALESRSMDALKRVWPGLAGTQESAIRRDFQNSTRIDVEIVNPQITVNGPLATVVFTRRYEVQTVDRQQLRSESRTTMSLQRVGTNWTIDQISYEPIR